MLDKIIQHSEKLFTKYGIKSVTMDDVARELGISKKTLYQHVSDKDDLVKKTIEWQMLNIESLCAKVVPEHPNAIDQILQMANCMMQMHQETNPSVLYDLRKYHPDSYQFFMEHKDTIMFEQVKTNLKTGVSQGLFRKDLNLDIIAKIYMDLVESAIVSPKLNIYKFHERYKETIMYHLHAISSVKGLEYLNHNKKKLLNSNI